MKIQYDSRKVQSGDIFFAVPGLYADGRAYMQQAIDNGATKIFYEADNSNQFKLPITNIPLEAVDGLYNKQGEMAAEFYEFPARHLNVIGITGTNGKTSVAYFIAQCLKNAAVIGTTGYGSLNNLHKHDFTTPMAPDVQYILKEFADNNIATAVMEVSSHALDQQRVSGVEFDTAVFTNLTHDHLDYHGDMLEYAKAKKKLFAFEGIKQAIINIDDPIGREIYNEFHNQYSIYSYSINDDADICALNITTQINGFEFTLKTPWGKATCRMPLLGRFNISNVLATVGALGVMDISVDDIATHLAALEPPPGRMQLFHVTDKPTVIVDFAHTPDALKQALLAVREHCRGQIYTVFGCGGDRDIVKRQPMGEVASTLSDYVIVTNDNPRDESPIEISRMICQGIDNSKLLKVELDRHQAITHAIKKATSNDIILVAGKGHEDYQIIGNESLPFNDIDIVKTILY
jgi:UDP-N-acetylmuramoyl-L-alanyl-D-glutamate--2,6-diaminopimelate ligase